VTLLLPLALPIALAAVALGVWYGRRIEARRRDRARTLAGYGPMAAALRPNGRSGAGGPNARRGAGPGSRALGALPGLLVVLAFLCFAVAVARPQATLSLPRIEGTLLLTFDVSGSMAADDVTPSRMEAAKAAAKAIVDRQPPGVVIGVVAFSDAGLTVEAPTSDTTAVLQTIERLGPTHGTSLGQGILAALTAIDEAESDTPATYYSNRSEAPTATPGPVAPGSHGAAAIVLFSDGENNEQPDPLEAATVAANRGIRVLTIGVGTTTGKVLDLDGFRVQTALDEGLLEQVATLTAGTYQPATGLDAGSVYAELSKHLVARDEDLELTAVIAGVGLLVLIAAAGISLVRTGRLP